MYITKNPIIKDFGYFVDTSRADGLMIGDIIKRYLRTRYVTYLSFWANYKLDGLNVRGYHAVNLLIHIFNSVLVCMLVTLTFRTPFLKDSRFRDRAGHIGLFSGLFFAAHPVQTEAVTYITQRFVSLASMFYLLSIVTYARSRLSDSRASGYVFYAASIISAVLAMKSKEIAFTLPLAIVLFEFMFFAGPKVRRAFLVVPLLLTMLIIPVGHISLQEGDMAAAFEGSTRLQTDIARSEYVFTQFRVIVTYIRLLFLPVNQNFDYHYLIQPSFVKPQVFIPFLLLVSIFWTGLYFLGRSRRTPELRVLSFGIFWFFLALSVESSIIPISELIFEYRAYLPSAGAIIAMVFLFYIAEEKLRREGRRAGKVLVPALTAITLLFSTATYARNLLWEDGLPLLEDIVRKSPNKARGHINLGKNYRDLGLDDKAMERFETAIRLKPDAAEAYNNIATLHFDAGRLQEALDNYLYAARLSPDAFGVYYNLGNVYKKLGKHGEAINNFERALELNPDLKEARNNLGSTYMEMERWDEAIEHFNLALSVKPGFAVAYYNLGIA
jgi:Flp pilus assembly protein TadD